MSDTLDDMTFIHRKVFEDSGMADSGTLVQIYYKYDTKNLNILVEDYSIHFIIDGVVGANIADEKDLVSDDLYRLLFKKAYHELLDYVILKKKK
jgi:hypothetical protein